MVSMTNCRREFYLKQKKDLIPLFFGVGFVCGFCNKISLDSHLYASADVLLGVNFSCRLFYIRETDTCEFSVWNRDCDLVVVEIV
jgi:hypothetical protein